MILGKNIRYLRLKKEISQDYIAEKLGYKSYTTIQKWESGISEPPIAKVKLLAELFNVSINDLTLKDLQYQELHPDESDSISLSDEEKNVVIAYRKSSEEIKNAICSILNIVRKKIDSLNA